MTNALNKTETEILNRLSNRTWIVVESFMGHGKRIQNNREVLAALSLASKGLINQMLMGVGLTETPIDFLGNNTGLYVGLSYAYLLVMIFPLYNAIESLDKNQIEAARDLGAPWWKIHRDVVIPYAKPGIASCCTMVFMLSAGSLAAPQLVEVWGEQGAAPVGNAPCEFAAYVKAEIAKWAEVVKASGARID